MPWSKEYFLYLKAPQTLRVILRVSEVVEFFRWVGVLKHRAY